jgi:putative ABC transport system substrate-binding protein
MQFDRLKRRDFITLVGGAAATWPLAARAQQPMPVIGFLNVTSPDTNANRLRAFRQGLKDTGYIEGENVAIEYRWAEGQHERLPALAAGLVRRQVFVIAALGPAPAFATKAATTTIPIVFAVNDDPVRLGLVASLARPGGNATGINFFTAELGAKRLDLLRELVPAATRVAVLVNPADASSTESTLRDVQSAARAMGLQIQVLNASTIREVNTAFATMVRARPDALFMAGDAFFSSRLIQLAHLATRHCNSRDLCTTRVSRRRRADQLRTQPRGYLSPSRRLCRPHPQGRKSGGPARNAVDQVRAGHQHSGRRDVWSRRGADAARARRRGDRIKRLFLLRCEGSDAIGAKRTCRERWERVDLTKMTRCGPWMCSATGQPLACVPDD